MNGTNASGCTIFLREGGRYVCVARFGKAPTVGTALRLRGGLFADCIEARQLVVCYEDAPSKLADLPYKQRPNCSSAALVPFELDGRVEGVLAVFSTFPFAFRQTAWDKLSAIAMVIESVLFSVTIARSGHKFGATAPIAESAPEAEAPDAPPPASYDSDQDFLRHMRSMLPQKTETGAAAQSDSDAIDAILAKVCGDLEMITGRAPSATPQVSLESMAAAPQQAHSGLAFNFDDEQRAAEMRGLRDSAASTAPAKPSAGDDVSVRRPQRSDAFDLSALAMPEAIAPSDPAIDDAQAAADELMRQVGSQIDDNVASSYLDALGAMFAQPSAEQAPAPSVEEILPAPIPDVPPPVFAASPETARPKAAPIESLRPVAVLPPPDEEPTLPARPTHSPWTIALIVLFVTLLIAATVWISRFRG